MKKLLLILGIALLIAAGWWLFRGENIDWPVANDRPRAEVVVAFGDSLTFGHGAAEGESYPDHLARLLGTPVVNKGVNGLTTGAARNHIRSVLAHKPNVVIVTLGGNDVLRKVPVAESVENLREILVRLKESGALVVYAAVDPPLLGENWAGPVRELCREEGVLYVPSVLSGLWGDAEKMSDTIHPNGVGYRVLAERIHARLRDHIQPAT